MINYMLFLIFLFEILLNLCYNLLMDNLILDIQINKKMSENILKQNHNHNGYELIFVLNGNLSIIINNQKYDVGKNTLLLISPLQAHQITYVSNDYLRSYVVINSLLLDKILFPKLLTLLKSNFNDSKICILDEEKQSLFKNDFDTIYLEHTLKNEMSENYISNILTNMFIRLYRDLNVSTNFYNETATSIQTYIDNNYKTLTSINELCRVFNMSAGHLSRFFKKNLGYTPIEYLVNVRLYNASILLTNTKENIMTISNIIGYTDYNNFIRSFKKKYSLSPLEFRKIYS